MIVWRAWRAKTGVFSLKGAWNGGTSPSRSRWGVLVFTLLLGFRNSSRQRRGLFSLFRIKFHHFSVSNRTITRCLGKFLSYFLRFFPLLSYVFVQNFQEFVQNKIFLVQKPEEIPACFFSIFGIFLCGLRIFLLFSLDFSGGKIRFFNLTVRQW